MRNEECVFCKIANSEIPSHIIYEDEIICCFLDIDPINEGHVLIVTKYPNFIAKAYFHTSLELQNEIESVGLETIKKHAIEGIIWFTPCLNDKWEDTVSRERLLNIVRSTENEDEIMGMSPHFTVVSRK